MRKREEKRHSAADILRHFLIETTESTKILNVVKKFRFSGTALQICGRVPYQFRFCFLFTNALNKKSENSNKRTTAMATTSSDYSCSEGHHGPVVEQH
jgi:hypothetical protein